MNRIPANGTAVGHVDGRRGTVSRTGDAPGGLLIEVLWSDNTLSWHRADELDREA